MPNKTIYVKEEDLPIYERAAKIAGDSLSGVVSDALKEYVLRKEIEGAEIKETIIEVGTWGADEDKNTKKIIFEGEKLAELTEYDDPSENDKTSGADWEIYKTKKGKYLVYRYKWSRGEKEINRAEYFIINSLPETSEPVKTEGGQEIILPNKLIQKALRGTRTAIERLDI
jgi:hypothetical protein